MADLEKTAPDYSSLKWWILLTVIIGTFLGRLDQTIVGLALPKIISDFRITVSMASWISTAYILANAIFVPIWGKLGDTIGRKKVYILGFSIFILGSVLAGLAWNLNSMIAFRIIQAIASSADYPTAMAILTVTFKEGKERAQALGIWSSSFAAAVVFGPLIGGPLIDHFSWRAIFLINLPIGILGLVMALIFVRESVSEAKNRFFDWWGAITLGVALSALVLVLDKGIDWGWLSDKAFLCYLIMIVFVTIFIKIEHKVPEPIVDLKFFRNKSFINILANNYVVFMGMMGGVFLIPIFAQTFLGYTATQSGYLFMPMAFFMLLAAPLGGSLIGKIKSKYVIAASTLIAGFGLYFFTNLNVGSTAWGIIIPLSIMAFGMGVGMAQRTNIVASLVPAAEIGVASSILALVRNISGAFGIAVFSTILTDATNSNVIKYGQYSVLKGLSAIKYQQFIELIILKSQISAYHTVFITAAVVLLLGSISALWLNVKNENKDVKIMIE
jgi:DHA2 family multidrug resistance protein